MTPRWFALLLAAAAVDAIAAPDTCGSLPRVELAAPVGYCAGRVADASDGLRSPRRILEVAPGRFWIVDMGSWEPRRGKLLELRPDAAASARVRVLAQGLDRPHGMARGPDGASMSARRAPSGARRWVRWCSART